MFLLMSCLVGSGVLEQGTQQNIQSRGQSKSKESESIQDDFTASTRGAAINLISNLILGVVLLGANTSLRFLKQHNTHVNTGRNLSCMALM